MVGFALIVVFGSRAALHGPGDRDHLRHCGGRHPPRAPAMAAWVATASTVPSGLLTPVGFGTNDFRDGLILLFATLTQRGAALALHRGPPAPS